MIDPTSFVASEPACLCNLSSSTDGVYWVNEFDGVQMKCSVSFNSNWAPAMLWGQLGGAAMSNKLVVPLRQPDSSSISLTFTATSTISGTQVFCRTYFDGSDRPKTATMMNIPEYSYTWTVVINVIGKLPLLIIIIVA